MKKENFLKGVALFLATFSNIKADKNTQNTWFIFLKDLPDEHFEYAIMKICREVREFYPTTNFVALVRDQLKIDITTKAMFAWESVIKTMGKSGTYSSVQFSDPVIHSVVEYMGGWQEFCQIPVDQWMRKNFIEAYAVMAQKNKHPKYLKGIFEIENIARGYTKAVLKPKQIVVGMVYQLPVNHEPERISVVLEKLHSEN